MIDELINQVHCSDALEMLRRLPNESVDMGFFDLPYGTTAAKWDVIIPFDALWTELKRVAKPRAALVFTASQPFTSMLVSSNYKQFRHEWIWDKNVASSPLTANVRPMPRHESVLVFGKQSPHYYPQFEPKPKERIRPKTHREYKVKVSESYVSKTTVVAAGSQSRDYKYPVSILKIQGLHPSSKKDKRYHVNQKPIALLKYLIETYSREEQLVIDITCGSGTTAVAAQELNRAFICCDNDERYVEIARARLKESKETYKQRSLL